MSTKSKGICPFCAEMVTPSVTEENLIRRDKCACTACGEGVYVCRSPGCNNYAKGGEYYDDELCPQCTSGIADAGKMTVAMAVFGAIVGKFIKP